MNNILTVNAGSSSLKCALYRVTGEQPELLYNFKLANILGQASFSVSDGIRLRERCDPDLVSIPAQERHRACLDRVLEWLRLQAGDDEITAISHRVVHGGREFSAPMRVDATALERLKALIPLAPLHQPYNLKLIELCRERLPQLPQVACFDTMFHSGQAPEAIEFALPRQLTEEGIRRYGFHGLSYEYIQRRLTEIAPEAARQKTIVAHLGAGASMCAIDRGRSVTSTMGFTALDGLPMGTRCGNLDPGVLLYLMREHHMDADRLETLLYKESGWLGVSGISGDMQQLLASPSPAARQAIDLFGYRAAREMGSLAAALQGLEQIVFTGGVGENSPEIRANIIERCHWLGARLNDAANRAGQSLISSADSTIRIRVIATDEEAMLALHVLELLDEE